MEDKVLSHLDNVKDNLDKNGKYKKKKKKTAGRMLFGRRLGKKDLLPEMPKDKQWDSRNDDPFGPKFVEWRLSKKSFRNNKKRELSVADKIKLQNEKDSLLSQDLNNQLAQLLTTKKTSKKVLKSRVKNFNDGIVFKIKDELNYNFLNGLGKSGFKRIEIEEAKILNEIKDLNRLDDSL